MPVPHYNYYPPAGQVVDATDGRVQWNGRSWMLKGRVYGVPSSHRLIGRPGGPLAGWYYDWGRRAWMEPSAAPATQPQPRPAPRPQPRPTPPPQPAAKPPQKKEQLTMGIGQCATMNASPKNVMESLVKHPVAPLLGGLLLVASNLTEEPQPPVIPNDLPEAVQKQWQMIYGQNQQRFQRRMELYQNIGMVLLGYSSTQSLLDVLPASQAANAADARRVLAAKIGM